MSAPGYPECGVAKDRAEITTLEISSGRINHVGIPRDCGLPIPESSLEPFQRMLNASRPFHSPWAMLHPPSPVLCNTALSIQECFGDLTVRGSMYDISAAPHRHVHMCESKYMQVREALQELLQLHRYPFLLSFLPHSQRYHHLAPHRSPIPPLAPVLGRGRNAVGESRPGHTDWRTVNLWITAMDATWYRLG